MGRNQQLNTSKNYICSRPAWYRKIYRHFKKAALNCSQGKVGQQQHLWISLNRSGEPKSAVYFQGQHYYIFKLERREIRIFLTATAACGIPLDTLVVDGINQQVSADLITNATAWIDNKPGSRKVILSSSSKVKEIRSHQNNMITYLTIHSWSLEEFQSACITDGQPTRIYQQASEVLRAWPDSPAASADEDASTSEDEESGPMDDSGTLAAAVATDPIDNSNKKQKVNAQGELDSVPEAPDEGIRILAEIAAKYRWSGGSARWMFNYSRSRLELLLRQYCSQAINCDALLKGQIGPTSDASTNYFFGSSIKKDNKSTEYFLVSHQAVRILAESASHNTF